MGTCGIQSRILEGHVRHWGGVAWEFHACKLLASLVQRQLVSSMPHAPLTFLDLPGEIRNMIYELVVLCPVPILVLNKPGLDLQARILRLAKYAPSLLRASRAVHAEAASLFYGRNCFNLSTQASVPQLFLEQIGRVNAGYIRHVHIEFPRIRGLEAGPARLSTEACAVLDSLQSHCVNLRRITTSQASTAVRLTVLVAMHGAQATAEAVALVDARFRAIPSLREIEIQILSEHAIANIRELAQEHGWTVITETREDGSGRALRGMPVSRRPDFFPYLSRRELV
ncbi:hypothetical protein VTK73DRAFT_8208 [Phialemonium thermophilum]|uniref:Uncharacterized protein n=1 Tax=Phialemonium thermophilum TaxID=223376 RepID=A0ABR3WA15_9PEZI